MVLKQLGMASVSIQAGVEGFLELEPNSNTRFLSGRTVRYVLLRRYLLCKYVNERSTSGILEFLVNYHEKKFITHKSFLVQAALGQTIPLAR